MNPFDAKAAEWDDSPLRRKMNRAIAAAISEAVPLSKTMSALDFGCGTGLIRRELFPMSGKTFSSVWQKTARLFPRFGKNGLYFSKVWILGNGTTFYTAEVERMGGVESVP